MKPLSIPSASRLRTLPHPGPWSPVRIEHRHAARARHLRLRLPPRATLLQGLVDAMAAACVRNASLRLVEGGFARLQYCIGGPDPTGRVVADYAAPIPVAAARLLVASATFARDAQDAPLVHCHAVFVTEDGVVRGGHLLPDAAWVGATGITAYATTLDDFDVQLGPDAETGMSVLRPRARIAHG